MTLPGSKLFRTLVTLWLLALSGAVGAATGKLCQSADVFSAKLISNICWSCAYPIKALAGTMGDQGEAPSGANSGLLCTCNDALGLPTRIGLSLGMYHPLKLIETVRVPFCSPVFGGLRLQDSYLPLGGRNSAGGSPDESGAFYNGHVISFPLYTIVSILTSSSCTAEGYTDVDIVTVSEIDPCHSDDQMGLFCQPEASLFANPLAQLATFVDGPASSIGKPMDNLFWVAGTWGTLTPPSGHVSNGQNPVRDESLVLARMSAQAHRRGLFLRTIGDDVMCSGGQYFPNLKKSQYKVSMFYPTSEAKGSALGLNDLNASVNTGTNDVEGEDQTEFRDVSPAEQAEIKVPGNPWGSSKRCCHHIGESTFRWGESRHRPSKEDHVYLMFQWVDCCLLRQ